MKLTNKLKIIIVELEDLYEQVEDVDSRAELKDALSKLRSVEIHGDYGDYDV